MHLGASFKKSLEKGICDFGEGKSIMGVAQLKRCWKNQKDFFWFDENDVCKKAKTCLYADCPHIK